MATYPIPGRLVAFAAKVESTAGTDSTPTFADNAIRLFDVPTVEEFYVAPNGRETLITGGLGKAGPATPSGRAYRIRGRFVPIGAGAAYSATVLPEADPLFIAAGFSRAVVTTLSAEKVTYSPSDDPTDGTDSTVSAYLELDNKKYALTYGVVESLSLAVTAGQFPVFDFSLVGIATAPSEQAVEAATYDSVAFPIWTQSSGLALNNGGAISGLKPESLSLDVGLAAALRAPGNSTAGHNGYKIVDRNPRLRASLETLALSTWNPFTDRANATEYDIDVTIGGTQYKRMKLDIDAGYITPDGLAMSEQNNLRHYDIEWLCSTPASGNELDIIFD